jgi:type IV pilus assembly protein PilQ
MRLFDSRKFLSVGALLLISTLAVNGASSKDTAVVKDVAFSSNGQSLEVRITASGEARFTYFELSSPHRLVVDFHGIQNQIGFRERAVESAGVERIRTSFFRQNERSATRIVFDLTGQPPYRVIDDGGGLVRIVFNSEDSNRAPMNLSAGPPVVPSFEANETKAVPAALLQSALMRNGSVELAGPPVLTMVESSALTSQVSLQNSMTALAIPTPRPALAATSQVVVAPPGPPQTPIPTTPTPTPQYTGEIISLDLSNIDVKEFFRLISQLSGLNIILDPNVAGTLTIRLVDVPWDQALDVVLRNYQFGARLEGNVLRIATNATLQAEENARKALRDAQDLAAELSTRTFILNYTKADVVGGTLSRLLSPRGSISQDLRRNALIVSDIPSQFGRLDEMVRFMDTPSPQVEIEARLLTANKSFTRDIGNQIGLLVGANSRNALTGTPANPSPFIRTPTPPVTTNGGLPLIADFPVASSSGLSFLMGLAGGDVLLDEIITLAEARGTAKLISRPRVTTQNNQAATVSQGTQIPVQTNVNNTVTTQFLTFALRLTVTPQITDAGTILLTVAIENSQPDFAAAVNGIPSVGTQQAQTQVLIPDGGTAVIGGILVDRDTLNIRQIPGLGSIPVIGNLFKSTQTLKSTAELIFFITPRIKPADTLSILNPPAAVAPGGGQQQ